MRLICTIVLLQSVWSYILCEDHIYTQDSYPNLLQDKEGCGRHNDTVDAAVCDPGNTLNEREVEALEQSIAHVREMRKCVCSNCDEGPFPNTYIKIAVAIIPDIVGEHNTTKERQRTVLSFAKHLRVSSWNFGECSDDIVIALALKERHVQTSIGHKTEETLSSECVQKIFEAHKHYFTEGKYYEGLHSLIEGYTSVLKGDNYKVCAYEVQWWGWLLVALAIGCTGVLCCCCCTGRCKGRGGGSGGLFDGGFGSGGFDLGGGGGDF